MLKVLKFGLLDLVLFINDKLMSLSICGNVVLSFHQQCSVTPKMDQMVHSLGTYEAPSHFLVSFQLLAPQRLCLVLDAFSAETP